MTHKQRMFNAIHGCPNDHLPWAPWLDLWFKANKQAGTLPTAFKNASLMELTDSLDMGFHAVVPWLHTWAGELHRRDKYLLTHTDRENSGLLQHYLKAQIDIADSICPKPMTRLTLKDVRDVFDGRITIMGGFRPSRY